METSHKPKFILIGDIMLDIYIFGSVSRIANEAPIPVLHQEYEKRTLGGCGNVLMNLLALGADTVFIFSAVGNDSHGHEIQQKVKSIRNVVSYICAVDNTKTITKFRGFTDRKMLFKYEIEDTFTLEKNIINIIKENILYLISSTRIDGILFSDYNKGYITTEITEFCIDLANKMNIPTFVDPKRDYKKYRGCTVFKPNTKEASAIFETQIKMDSLLDAHQLIKNSVYCKESVITMAEHGMSLLDENETYFYQPTIPTQVYDVTGAGDIVLALLSFYYKRVSKDNLLKLCTLIATRSVSHPGTYVISQEDISEATKLLSMSKLINVEDLNHMKSSIIITNGCFDILHEGHLDIFRYCSSLKGDNSIVVVALNSDESIQRLKGLSRPINPLLKRVAMLNHIHYIDWIVIFNEDTPEDLYKKINPDILVKGGDYKETDLPGREYSKEIKIFPYKEGNSTTRLIESCILSSTHVDEKEV